MNICTNCGKENRGSFCIDCGTRIDPATPGTNPQPNSAPQQDGFSTGPVPTPPPGYIPPTGYQTSVSIVGDTSVMTVGDWIVTLLLSAIPCVGLIMLIVWASSSTGNVNKRNFARAYLIFIGIAIALYLILWLILGAVMFSVFDAMAW